jgi:DNA repair protein RecO (recombination protein O)
MGRSYKADAIVLRSMRYSESDRILHLYTLERAADPQHDGLGLAFQLKLLAVAGYLPHLVSCASCGSDGALVGFSPAAGGAVCAICLTTAGGFRVAEGGIEAIESLLDRPLGPVLLDPPAAANALRVVEETYAHHGGFRLRTLSSA